MKKQFMIIGIITLLVCVGLSGCNSLNTENNKFVGTWTYLYPADMSSNYSFTYQFFSDGIYSFISPGNRVDGTFNIKDGKLVLKYYRDNGDEQSIVCSYLFSENNTKLTINETTYTRQ